MMLFEEGQGIRADHGDEAGNVDLGIVAVGVSAGQTKRGVDLGPGALLGSGLIEILSSQPKPPTIWHDYTIHTYRDLGEPELVEHLESVSSSSSSESSGSSAGTGMKRSLEVSYATECLAQQVYQHASQGRTVLTLGGDHSIAIGTVAGNARACRERHGQDLAVIWVDAHADINTPQISNSGNIHGMPVAFLSSLIKTAENEPFGWLEEMRGGQELLNLKNMVYIGLRDVEPEEQKILDAHGVKSFTNKDVRSKGIEQVMLETLEYIGHERRIHLSFDIDALDPSVAPSTGTPVAEGLTVDEGRYICRSVRETGMMVSMDLVEVNPMENEDAEGSNAVKTVEAGLRIVESAFSTERLV